MFEWDEAKNAANIAKHGVSFEDAVRIFERETLTFPDDRFDYGEQRSISIGLVRSLAVIVVAHVDREEVVRIISARPATRKERRLYDAEIASRGRP